MAFTARKLPAIPQASRLGDGLLLDILNSITTHLSIRFLGFKGDADTVVLHGELGVGNVNLTLVTNVRMNVGTLQKKTISLGLVNGIVTVVGTETDWVNA